ncbi:MAG: ATP-binding protein [Gaiellaceae bacterium]
MAPTSLARGCYVTEQRAYHDIALTSSEVLTNVVKHAYSAPGGEIDVSAEFDPEQLSIVLADDGRGLGRPGEGGLGLGPPIMSQVSDELTLRRRRAGRFEIRQLFAFG